MEFRSPVADLQIPEVSLPEFVLGGLTEVDAAREAIVHHATGQRLTFGQVRRDVEAVASWLAARGIGPGDAVTVALPNSPEFVTAFHGIVRSGAAASTANTVYQVRELAHVLRCAGSRLVVTNADLLQRVCAAAAEVGLAPAQIIVAGVGAREAAAAGGHTAYDDVLATEPDPPRLEVDPRTHVAALPMSMGYAGLPKAVELSHRNVIANVLQFPVHLEPIPPTASILAVVPMSHGYGITALANFGLRRRLPIYTMPAFQPEALVEIVETYRPTVLFIVPGIASWIATDPRVLDADWSSVELAVCGAASIEASVAAAVEERLGCDLVVGWGMTELSPIAAFRPRWRRDIAHTSIGMPIPNVVARVVDPTSGTDVAVPAGGGESAVGELWCRGDNVMLGFRGEPAQTARMVDADGWLHTGDLVTVTAEGCLTITGRCKDLIKSRGLQISPAELEAVLRTHPAVADAAVYPVDIPAAPGDQAPYALVQLAPGTSAKPFELIRFVDGQLAKYKQLKSVAFVDSIPRDAAGEIRRGELPGWAAGHTVRP